ncbi:DNA primase [Patescibacteria group bacterium]|nr:DNA primase [Patescibacteria group bacterium]
MINSPVEDIKNRLDLVDIIRGYIKLQKAGANYRAVCPFHNEKKPSFFVSPARQIWHCFGSCSEGGDMFKFVMKVEGVEFGDALRILAQKAGVELKKQDPKSASWRTERQRLYEITSLASRFFETQLEQSIVGKEAKKYLLDRGMSEETIKKWKIGYSPDVWQGLYNFLTGKGYRGDEIERVGLALKARTGRHYDRFRGRIVFPIFDLSSQIVGFGGRVFKQTKRHDGQEEAKYINSPATPLYDKSRILYGLNKAGIEIRKNDKCILVEGYMDAIMVNQAGFENVVATSGTALTPYQLRILKRYSDNLLTAFDMDLAGNSATKRGIDLAQAEGFNIKIVTMPEGKDPADVALEGSEKLKELVDNAKSIHDFYFDNAFSKYDKNTLDGKRDISKTLLPVIKKIPNKIEQTIWVQSLTKGLGVKEEDVLEELAKTKVEQAETYNSSKNNNPPAGGRKTRKEMLEERLAILIIKHPENANLIKQEDLKVFSLAMVNVIDSLKHPPAGGKESDKLNYLKLKADIEILDIDPEQEFRNCFEELTMLVVKDSLNNISREIKQAEQDENFTKVEELTNNFKNLCQERKS